MNSVPEKYQINKIIDHNEYLINGEISKWTGNKANVYSTLLCDSDEKEPLLIGTSPEMSSELAMEALNAASSSYDSGKGKWPRMKVYERINCMSSFVEKMILKRDEIVKLLMWEIGKKLK